MKKVRFDDKRIMGVDRWYSIIKNYTPKSLFIPLSQEEANAINKQNFNTLSLKEANFSQNYTLEDISINGSNDLADEEVKKLLSNITNKIDLALDGQNMFLRTNVMAIKDTCSGIISNGKEAVEKLLNGSKELFNWFTYYNRYNNISLVLREPISIKEEYRVFIKDNEIIGISQIINSNIIRCRLVVDESFVYENPERSMGIVDDFIKDVIVNCNIETAIIDVAIDKDSKLWVIDLNPYHDYMDKCILENFNFQYLYDKITEPVLAWIKNTNEAFVLLAIEEDGLYNIENHIIDLKYSSVEEYDKAKREEFDFLGI